MTSAITARSSRLRSFSDVLSAAQSAGTSRASASSCSREGSGVGRGLLGELGLGVGEFAELGLPAGLEAASNETVLGLAGVERALGTRGVIAGTLDPQLQRPVGARAAVCDLVGGGERDRDLLRRERLEQPASDELVDAGRLDRPAARGLDAVHARGGAVVVRAIGAVMHASSSAHMRRIARSLGTARCPSRGGR